MTGVLDASVILAVLNGEPGAEEGIALIVGGIVSAVNLSEVVAKLQRKGTPDDVIARVIDALECEIIPFDREQALAAGLMWREVKLKGLSLGDRACLALARARALPCYTAERIWPGLVEDIEVRLIR